MDFLGSLIFINSQESTDQDVAEPYRTKWFVDRRVEKIELETILANTKTRLGCFEDQWYFQVWCFQSQSGR